MFFTVFLYSDRYSFDCDFRAQPLSFVWRPRGHLLVRHGENRERPNTKTKECFFRSGC